MSEKRRARNDAAKTARAAAREEFSRAVGEALLPVGVHSTTVRRPAAPQPKHGDYIDEGWLEVLRASPCTFCRKAPRCTPQHFPPIGSAGLRNDLLTCPACGDGVAGCHGRAQRYEIPATDQCTHVGRSIARCLREGRAGWPAVEQALRSIRRRDWARAIRRALLTDLWGEDVAR